MDVTIGLSECQAAHVILPSGHDDMHPPTHFMLDDDQENDCKDSAVGVRGWVSEQDWEVLVGTGVSCAEEAHCLINASLPQCTDIPRTVEDEGYFQFKGGGNDEDAAVQVCLSDTLQ